MLRGLAPKLGTEACQSTELCQLAILYPTRAELGDALRRLRATGVPNGHARRMDGSTCSPDHSIWTTCWRSRCGRSKSPPSHVWDLEKQWPHFVFPVGFAGP